MLIHVKLQYGGNFQRSPTLNYVGGQVDFQDDIDTDIYSIEEINAHPEKDLSYKNALDLSYKFPSESMEGLGLLNIDSEFLKLLNEISKLKVNTVEVFVQRKIDACELINETGNDHNEEENKDARANVNEGDSNVEINDMFDTNSESSDSNKSASCFRNSERESDDQFEEHVANVLGDEENCFTGGPDDIYDGGEWNGNCQSDYAGSDELASMNGSSDDEAISKTEKYSEFNEESDFWFKIKLKIDEVQGL